MRKLPKFIYDEEKALERTRKILAEKIEQLNSAIDDVSAQLRTEDSPNGVSLDADEIEASNAESRGRLSEELQRADAVPSVLPPTRLLDDMYPEKVPVTIIDTALELQHSGLEARLLRLKKIMEAYKAAKSKKFVDQPSKVHMVGICGISGAGKTTTARAIYNLLHIHFEACYFCEDVKGMLKTHGLTYVQNQLSDDITKAGDEFITSVGQGITVIKKTMRPKNFEC